MSPTSYRAAPPRGYVINLTEGRRGVNLPPPCPLPRGEREARSPLPGRERGVPIEENPTDPHPDPLPGGEREVQSKRIQAPLTLPSPRRGEGDQLPRGERGARELEGTGAVGLGGLVAAAGGQRPEHAPGAARRQQPIGLAAEGAEELLLQALAPELPGTRQIGAQILDQRLGHDA